MNAAEKRELNRARRAMPNLDPELPIDSDPVALRLIEERGHLSRAEIGAAYGVTAERVRQIEVGALKNLALGLLRAGIPHEEIVEWLGRHRPETQLARAERDGGGGGSRPADDDWIDIEAPKAEPECEPWSEQGVRVLRAIQQLEAEAEVCEHAAAIVIAGDVFGEDAA
jgi:hypothetical protein